MKLVNVLNAKKTKDRPKLLVLSLFLSILLHLSVVFFIPYENFSSDSLTSEQQEPTIVRLVDKLPTLKNKAYELDQRPTLPTPEPPLKASRLAEQNQRVKKQIAPNGDDVRDQTAKPVIMQPPLPAAKKQPSKKTKKQQKTAKSTTQTARQQKPKGRLAKKIEKSPPPLKQLSQLTAETLSRIAGAEKAAQERIKQREDVDEGDTVWLNLERGLLISFFRRFRNQIEGVWNFPREAIEKEMQGTLLLKITVNPEGELLDVDLVNSSGYDILDYEAIQAVYRAAPFGPLGKHYPHPDLKIMANFRYQISGKYIYGQRR